MFDLRFSELCMKQNENVLNVLRDIFQSSLDLKVGDFQFEEFIMSKMEI